MTKDQMAAAAPPRQGQKRSHWRSAQAQTLRLEFERALEFHRRVGGGVGQPKLDANIQGEFRLGRCRNLVIIIVYAALVVFLAGIVEQGRANAVVLVVERPGMGEILDLAEHLDAHAPMLGEVILAAPTIFEAETVGLPVVADLRAENGIERQQRLTGGQFDNGSEFDFVGLAAPRREGIPALEREAETVTFALDKLVLRLELDPAQIEIVIERLVGRESTRDQEALSEAVFNFEVVALPEEFAFVLLLGGTARALFVLGLLALGLWEAIMDRAAIFEFDLALLDSRFLDFEFGEGSCITRHQPGQSQRKRPEK